MVLPNLFQYPLSKKIITEQFYPLRVIFYIHLTSFFIPELHLSLKTSIFIFNMVPVLVSANIAMVIFLEHDKLRKKTILSAFSYLLLLFVGLLTVEFLGIAVHTQTSFFDPHDPEVIYWNMIALLFTGIGGYLLPVTNYIGEKLDERFKPTRKQQKILSVFLLVIAISVNIFSMYVNPQWENFFNYVTTLI
ncbi:MAG: hypothetical protein ACW9W3_01070 [Candidatus Nitrosopumilus sp. bin_68KS]